MTAIKINLPASIAKKAEEFAREDGVSMDQFVSSAVSEKISAWMAEDVIERRAKRASREKFLAALAEAPDLPPDDNDRL